MDGQTNRSRLDVALLIWGEAEFWLLLYETCVMRKVELGLNRVRFGRRVNLLVAVLYVVLDGTIEKIGNSRHIDDGLCNVKNSATKS